MNELKFTGERMVGKTMKEVEIFSHEGKRHVDRYMWAADRIHGTRILDCACGSGYGTRYLSERFPEASVDGVDLDKPTIDYCNKYCKTDKINYYINNILELNLKNVYDSIVSLETIEHMDTPEIVLNNFRKLMLDTSNLIVSIPTIKSIDINPYHHWEVSNFEEGIAFFERNDFIIIDSWHQDNSYGIFNLKRK